MSKMHIPNCRFIKNRRRKCLAREAVQKAAGVSVCQNKKFRYKSNNGLDHVMQGTDGQVTIIIDSKQINNGSVKLGGSDAGMQLSKLWIEATLPKLALDSPARAAVESALGNGSLHTAIAGVDKATEKLVIFPVNVNKSAN